MDKLQQSCLVQTTHAATSVRTIAATSHCGILLLESIHLLLRLALKWNRLSLASLQVDYEGSSFTAVFQNHNMIRETYSHQGRDAIHAYFPTSPDKYLTWTHIPGGAKERRSLRPYAPAVIRCKKRHYLSTTSVLREFWSGVNSSTNGILGWMWSIKGISLSE